VAPLSNLLIWAVTGAYAAVAVLSIFEGNLPKATIFGGYALANIGVIYAV
jgi:hypothetical protein